MYLIGILMLALGIILSAIGIFAIVQARNVEPTTVTVEVPAPTQDEIVAKWEYEPGTVVLDEQSKPFIADVATIPAFMYDMWKTGMEASGVKIQHEQNMGNGVVMVAALVPQTPGACGHAECQPGYEAPPEDNFGNGQYL